MAELTEQQISALNEFLEKNRAASPVTEAAQPVAQPAASFKVKLGDQQYEARDQEELDRLLATYQDQQTQAFEAERLRIEADRQRQEAQQSPRNDASGDDKFDKEEYARLFMQDPRKAQHYLIAHDKEQLSFYGGILNKVSRLEQENAAAQFLLQNRDYTQTPANFQAIQSIIGQYNLPWNIDGMNAAYQLGLQTGAVKNKAGRANAADEGDEGGESDPQFVAPPRVSRRRSNAAVDAGNDVLNQFEQLTADQQRKYLESLTLTQ